jgi:SAM-dependent methyltransferase
MKLSTLVHLKNQLINSVQLDLDQAAKIHAAPMCHLVQSHEIQFPDLTKQIHDDYQDMLASFSRFSKTIDDVKYRVQDLIDSIENSYFVKSYELFQEHISQDDDNYILDRKLDLPSDTVEYLHARVRRYGDWHHAGLIIRPGRWNWIEDLVSCDPLYLVDTDQALLDPAVFRFKPQYQQRMRTYVVPERQPRPILAALPDGQFSLVFAYNFFHYRPFELVCKWLSEIFYKLRPGGTLFFTFNNCDWAHAVALTERHFMCYTPGHRIVQHLSEVGFHIQEHTRGEGNVYWIEARRPGQLTTMRAGQNLAKIVARSK